MPVRFPCPQCHQVLSVTRRKIGTQVNCPRCGNPNLVPDEETGAASVADYMISRPAPASGPQLISELIVYDDVPSLIGDSPAVPATATAPTPGPSGREPAPTTTATREPLGRDMLLISRRTLYFQGVLFVIVAAAAFSAGFFIGRGPSPSAKGQAGRAAGKDPVVLRGQVLYTNSGGAIQPDDGSIVAALPQGVVPDERISAKGLAPKDPYNPDADGIKAINKLGGDFVRADPSGNFQLVVPRSGEYHLFIVSKQSKRAAGRSIPEPELQEMASYFTAPSDLVGVQQFHWSLQHLSGSPKPMEHRFKIDK